MGKPDKSTLCWDCAKAIGFCSWSEDFIPVKGWKAVKFIKEEGITYRVDECPLFESDVDTIKDRRANHIRMIGEQVEMEMNKVSGNAWKSEPVTLSQLMYIRAIRNDQNLPEFKGRTRGQAAEWIEQHSKKYIKEVKPNAKKSV